MKTKERLKTLLLTVLLVGAIFLTYSIWFYDLSASQSLVWGSDGNYNEEVLSALVANDEMTNPFPFAISYLNDSGRFGAAYHYNSVNGVYEKTKSTLARALDSADGFQECTDKQWSDGLLHKGILFDFEGNAPVSLIARSAGVENYNRFSDSARYVLVLPNEIYIKNTITGHHYRAKHSVSGEAIVAIMSGLSAAKCSLAMDIGDERVAGETLLVSGNISSFIINGHNPAESFTESQLLSMLKIFGMNYNTCGKNTEQDGTRVFIEELNILEIAPDGQITYTSERQDNEISGGISVSDGTAALTQSEAIAASNSVVARLLQLSGGDGKMYMREMQRDDERFVFKYGWSFGGIPVDRQKTGYCASVEIEGGRICQIEFYMRSYESSGSITYCVPQKLAIASFADSEKNNISLRYTDVGNSGIEAQWYSKIK